MTDSKSNTILAIRLFFLYFILEILLKVLFTSFIDVETETPTYALNMSFLISHTVLIFVLVFRFNAKHAVLVKSDFNLNRHDLFPSILIGLSLGVFVPLIGNVGYFFENTFFFEFTYKGIQEMGEISQTNTLFQFYSLSLVSTLCFTLGRELFFRGLLLKLFRMDLKITVATLQVSFLFTLMYLNYQYNQIDVLSPLIINVILCYIVFITKSLIPALIVAMVNDIPFLVIVHNEAFIAKPENYLVFNIDHFLYYVIFFVMLIGGFYMLNKNEGTRYEG